MGGDVRASFYGRFHEPRNCPGDEHFTGRGGSGTASYACSTQKGLQEPGEEGTMKRHQGKDSEISLKQAVAALRAEKPEAETIEAASEKVWQRLTESAALAGTAVDSIHGCHDVRLLLPQYRGGQLSPAKALLVNAHLHECVACRREAATGK